MDKIDDLNKRALLLKKRFREPDMKEIFDSNSRSIIEVINKIKKHKSNTNKSTKLFQFKEKSSTTNKDFFSISNGVDVTPTQNDAMMLSNESEKKSVGSGKGSKKKEAICKAKSKPPSTKPIQKPPEDNLMNLEWMSSSKFPPVKLNKPEKPTIKIDKKLSQDEESKPSEEKLIIEEEKINTFNTFQEEEENSYYDKKESLFDHTLPPEIMGDSEREMDNDLVINNSLEKDASLNHHNNTISTNQNNLNQVQEIAKNNNKEKCNKINDNIVINSNILNNTNTSSVEVNKKFSIPLNPMSSINTLNSLNSLNFVTNSETAMNNSITTNINKPEPSHINNSYVKKNSKIIDDDDEEEVLHEAKIILPNHSTNTTATKIKIALTSEMQEVISAHNDEGKKSVSSKSIDNKETTNKFPPTIELHKDQLNTKVKKIIHTNAKEKVLAALNKSKESSNSMAQSQISNSNIKLIKSKANNETNNSKSNTYNIVNDVHLNSNSQSKTNVNNNQTNRNSLKFNNSNSNSSNSSNKPIGSNPITNSFNNNPISTPVHIAPVVPKTNNEVKVNAASSSTGNSANANRPSLIPYVHKDELNENIPVIEGPKKLNSFACFLNIFKSSLDAIENLYNSNHASKSKHGLIQGNATESQEASFEFKTFHEVLSTFKEDQSVKGINYIITKSTRILIKIFGLINREESSELFLSEIITILDSINEVIKKLAVKEELVSKVSRHLKVVLKFVSSILKLRSFKTQKIKSLISEAENNLNKKTFDKSSMNSVMKYLSLNKSYSSQSEKMHKILLEIKKEEEENIKKKGKENKDFMKTLDKIKKTCRTNPSYLDSDKIYTMLKNVNDLILTYIKESE